jgi:hypothetical protein
MNASTKLMTILGIISLSSSLNTIALCPHNELVTAKIEDLATHGKATIENETYHLIGRDVTNIFYQNKLLENDAQLNGFLKVSSLLDNNLPKAQAHLIDLVPTPNFCAYEISLGDTKQVIALSTAP